MLRKNHSCLKYLNVLNYLALFKNFKVTGDERYFESNHKIQRFDNTLSEYIR